MSSETDLYSRWFMEMRRSRLFQAGDRVGVAVSGGPDSVLLLEFMTLLAPELGLALAVVHFNHHLRGAESDADEAFVRAVAERKGREYLGGGAPVAEVARERGRNVEATARELRYQFFFSLASRGVLSKVATAHSATDQAETVLLKLLRGTGTRGLGGIYPVLEGNVVRPFLSLTRDEIQQEVRERRLEFRVDSTNLDAKLRRNKVRLELLPLLEKEFNPEVVALLKELADRARDDENYLEQQAREQAQPWRVREGSDERIPVRALLDFPPAVARRVLRQMVEGAQGNLRGVAYRHIEALRAFASGAQSGQRLVLPGRVVARKEFDWLVVGRGASAGAGFCYPVKVPGEVFVPQLGTSFYFKIVRPAELIKAYNGFEKAGLDPLKLADNLRLRSWRAGDRFQPLGSRRVRKLKELFRERKIPLAERRFWPVLESERQIVWVRGFPPAHPAAAGSNSGKVLYIEEGSCVSR